MSPLGIAIGGLVIGFTLWAVGKVLIRVGTALEEWGDRH